MIQNELIKILEMHKKWLNGDANGEKANLSNANLSYANLDGADLSNANLSGADLHYANLSNANLHYANLSNANLSCAKGLVSTIDFIQENFECTEDGYVVYKAFNGTYKSPASWDIAENSVLSENVNANRENNCGCGINVAPLAWVKEKYPNAEIYKLLIKWEWLPGVVVPYNTDGKIRCEKAMILGKVDDDA